MFPHQRNILIVPLDWGLGHITRCIPIIKHLMESGHRIVLGGNEVARKILTQEFPDSPFVHFEGYDISYPEKAKGFLWSMISQVPKLYFKIRSETKRTKEIVKKYKIDTIISDNRFGVRHTKTENIFITHQLNIHIPQSRYLKKIVNQLNKEYARRFDHIWIPDYPGPNNLSHTLSRTEGFKGHKIHYLGIVSRFERDKIPVTNDILVILSGPEPQRTLLENKLIDQMRRIEKKVIFLRGKPLDAPLENLLNIEFQNHLDARELNRLIESSDIIISRTGYTTVMDLIKLNKRAILIPTPGQTEQELLGGYYKKQNWFVIQYQNELDIQKGIKELNLIDNPFVGRNFELYKQVINHCLKYTKTHSIP